MIINITVLILLISSLSVVSRHTVADRNINVPTDINRNGHLNQGIDLTNTVNIDIYTDNAAPFSYNGEGYSIDYIHDVLKIIYDDNYTSNTYILNTTQQIIDAVKKSNDTELRYALGISAISTVIEANNNLSSLPPYFQTELQIMVKPDRDINNFIVRIVTDILTALGVTFVLCLLIIYLVAPIVWFFELGFPQKNKIPIFINWGKRNNYKSIDIKFKNKVCCQISPKVQLISSEIKNAFVWTVLTMTGTETGYPNSRGGKIIHSLLKALRILIFMTVTAALTAVMTTAARTTTIENFSDLSGETVCTVNGSVSEDFLINHNNGYSIVSEMNIDSMLSAFWNDTCTVVVYDYQILQYAISKIRENNETVDVALIGTTFNTDYYGVALNKDNPVESQIKDAIIQLNNDLSAIDQLKNKWLKNLQDETGDDSLYISPVVYITVGSLGLVLLLIAVIWLYKRYEEKNEGYRQIMNAYIDTEYQDNLEDAIEKEKTNEYIYKGVDELVDKELVPNSIRNTRLLYEILLILKGKYDEDVVNDNIFGTDRNILNINDDPSSTSASDTSGYTSEYTSEHSSKHASQHTSKHTSE